MGSVTMVFKFLAKLIPWIAGETDLVSNSIFNLNKWTCKTTVLYSNAEDVTENKQEECTLFSYKKNTWEMLGRIWFLSL